MKRCAKYTALLLAVILCAAIIPQSVFGTVAPYNDAEYDKYENMRDKEGVVKYTVPTLFKNDASYKNVKKYPLIVNDSVQYVPLEMFIGLSKIYLKTDLGNGNFYIANLENDHFVSFDVMTNMVATHDKNPFYCETKFFYDTVYVPAVFTAKELGIVCEIYDNAKSGVYALRFSDSAAKLSIDELIKMYSPIKIQPVNPDDKEPDTETIGRRTIYLTFENCPNEHTGAILDVLASARQKATFFCSYEGIKNYPALIRRMYVEGHRIGIYAQGEDALEQFEKANELLGIIIKNKTRLLRVDFEITKDFIALAEQNGIKLWGYNIDGADTIYSSGVVYERIVTRLESLEENRRTTYAAIRFTSSANARRALMQLLGFINGKNQLNVVLPNEATTPIYS